MSRFGRRSAEIAVRTLQLMVLAAVLLAVIAVVWLRRIEAPRPAPPAQAQPAALPAPAPNVVAAPPAPESAPEAPPPKPELKGPTRFVRRLEAGELLRELSVSVDDGVGRVALRLLDLLPALLYADRYRPRATLTRVELARSIEFLTDPPRDLQRVRLFERVGADPLGHAKLVRVWTLGDGYAAAELRSAEETLRHVAGVAQFELPRGVDVMITPGMGRDVFPWQSRHAGAAGVYFGHDRYCVVRSRLMPRFREEVLKHELMHAYCHQFTKEFISSSFVSEGLAEYLRLCRVGDPGFHVPPERLGGNLSRLLRMLEESRIPLREVQPELLVRLSRRHFYALGSLGYLLAQASMAFVGGNVIERAFRDRSDQAVVDSIVAIRWPAFLRFVSQHAGEGAPAITVEDLSPGGTERWERSRDAVREALWALGVARNVDIDPTDLVARPELLVTTRQIAAVLRDLCAPARAPVLFTEISEAMDGEITLAGTPESFRPFHEMRGPTPRDFVADLYSLLERQYADGRQPRLVALTPKPIDYPLGRVAPYSIAPFFEELRVRRSEGRWILCLGPRARLSKKERAQLATSPGRREFAPPEVLLVIDLSDGSGDALPLAKYLACCAHPGSRIAYWNPQRR